MDVSDKTQSDSQLSDYEIRKLAKFFDVLLKIDHRQKVNNLRTDKGFNPVYNKLKGEL